MNVKIAPPVRLPMSETSVVAAGIRVADAEGLDAVSIRRIAAEFAGRPMSVYSFVESKQRLLELMVDSVMGELLVEHLPTDWRHALHAISARTLEAGSTHTWLAEGTVRTRPHGPNALEHERQSLGALDGLPLPQGAAESLLMAVDAYTIGFAMTHAPRSPGDRVPPVVLRTFSSGLDWILDGFAREHRVSPSHATQESTSGSVSSRA